MYANDASYTGASSLQRTWYRCPSTVASLPNASCTAIASAANQQTYYPQAADVGDVLAVEDIEIGPTPPGNQAVTYSPPSAVVLPAAPTNTGLPSITGTARVASTLTGTPPAFTGATTVTNTWYRCPASDNAFPANNCTVVGHGGTSYVVQNADSGSVIEYVSVASNAGGTDTVWGTPTTAVYSARR